MSWAEELKKWELDAKERQQQSGPSLKPCRAEAPKGVRRKWDSQSEALPGMSDLPPSRKPKPTLWK